MQVISPNQVFNYLGVICKFMRNECLSHTYAYDSKHPVDRLVLKLASKSAAKTNSTGARPFGVGLLIVG